MPPQPSPPPQPSSAPRDLGYGSFASRVGYLRQDTRPLPFISVKLRRYVTLTGTRLSVSKSPSEPTIWSFDIAGASVEAFPAERKIIVFLTDSMRRRRRVIVLVAGRDDFDRWRFWLRRASEAVLERHYSMCQYINTGSFARVVRGRDLHNGREVAIKLIEKSSSPPSSLRYMAREVAIMRRVRHENIVECLDVFDGLLRTRIVMELCPGVLQDVIDESGRVEESLARGVLVGVLRGLEYLHSIGIVHRDVKPSNILISSKDAPYGPVKLSDFGLSNYAGSDDAVGGARGTSQDARQGEQSDNCPVLSSEVGTLAFVAPDLLLGQSYGPAVDLWSAGIVLYIMLAGGRLPFRGETSSDLLTALKGGDVDMQPLEDVDASEEARSLLLGLLNVDPDKRLSAGQALVHPWIVAGEPYVFGSKNAEGEGEKDARGEEKETEKGARGGGGEKEMIARGGGKPAPAKRRSQSAGKSLDKGTDKANQRGLVAPPRPPVQSVSAPGPRRKNDLSIEVFVSSAVGSRGHALLGL